jgi:hypothetical protein
MWRVLNQNLCVGFINIDSPYACLPPCFEIKTYNWCMYWRAFGGLVRSWCRWKAIAFRLSWEIEPWYWNLTRLVRGLERDGVVYRGGKVDNPIKFVHFHCLFCERVRKPNKNNGSRPKRTTASGMVHRVQAQTITWQAS